MQRHSDEKAELIVGAIAGVIATAAMTWAAAESFRRLPDKEQYPLPPREITDRLLSKTLTPRPAVLTLTVANHFLFGAACGALSRLLPPACRSSGGSVGYALGVWVLSYFGWIPASRILRAANTHPPRRNALMIACHAVWGTALWASAEVLSRSLDPLRRGPANDAPCRPRRCP
jgi:hypothetical protein